MRDSVAGVDADHERVKAGGPTRRLVPLGVILLSLASFTACGEPRSSHDEIEQAERATVGLLPDTQGGLDTVVVSVNSARRAALRNARLVTNIVNGLPASTRILILTNDRAAFALAKSARPDQVEFVELPADNPITIWTQDPFLVVRGGASGEQTTLLTPSTFGRAGDDAMAEHVARYTGYELRSSELFFEGGNVVSDEENVLIGANTIRHNARALSMSEVDIAVRFESELGRPVLVIGPVPQPVAHIDMVLTPLGGNRILVADANAGARIAERALRDDPQSVADFERSCEEYFFGDPGITGVQGKDGHVLVAPQVQGRTRSMIELSRTVASHFDGIAESLLQHGYIVERVPFLFGGPESVDTADEPRTNAAYPMLTYNNVLIADGVVFLPRYGWAAMDDSAATVWRNLGFEPQVIDGLTISAMYGGALRCSVKVLERTPG